ncbi:hypothetical protein ACSLBF_11195 [Pseudoalteromonas sp. T1lg65]|uniref:hypothetical protein n=1 Tax=Pseudoalteromonas sp. T1lg65 TaxID=2077101 RepID=UPI003F7901FB
MAKPGTIISNAETRSANPITSNSSEIPATKQFAVNATGNLFIASTLNSSAAGSDVPAEAQQAFGEVSVFFAALTKAMAEEGKSLYDYDALNDIVSKSGLFVKVTQSDYEFHSKQRGVTLSTQLVQTLLGLSGNLASVAKSLTDMISGMGKAAITISGSTTSQSNKVGTLIFVCEYLLGAISITPIVMSLDATEAKKEWEAGPCIKGGGSDMMLNIQKTVYLFVPPSFVKSAATLNEAMSDPEFNNLVDSLKEFINIPTETVATDPAPAAKPKKDS